MTTPWSIPWCYYKRSKLAKGSFLEERVRGFKHIEGFRCMPSSPVLCKTARGIHRLGMTELSRSTFANWDSTSITNTKGLGSDTDETFSKTLCSDNRLLLFFQLSQLTVKTLKPLIPKRCPHNVPEPPAADPKTSACLGLSEPEDRPFLMGEGKPSIWRRPVHRTWHWGEELLQLFLTAISDQRKKVLLEDLGLFLAPFS